jgi:hypothetical protein
MRCNGSMIVISTPVDQVEPGAWTSHRVFPVTCFSAIESHESSV